jgi:hypothetical protein
MYKNIFRLLSDFLGGCYSYEGGLSVSGYTAVDITTELSDSNIYQLCLRKGTKVYWTYVYIDSKIEKAMDAYKKAIEKRLIEEQERQGREYQVMRSFEIQNFGIYNWDKFYKDDNELLVHCKADFNFEVANEYTNITVFLITGENRNAVIKYYAGSFDKFNFNPALYNKLVAVLPDNKIAIFEDKDFKALDLNKIREEKEYKFEMKILGNVNAMDALKAMTDVAT